MSPTLSPELDDTLHLIARQAQELTLASGAAIALIAAKTDHRPIDEMTCRASAGEDAPGVGARLHIGSGFSGECVREGKLLRCDDSESDPRVDRDNCRSLGIRSMIAVPVKHGESVLGIIEVFSPHTKAFTEGDVNELEHLAARVTSIVGGQTAIAEKTSPSELAAAPRLLLELPSARATFVDNLRDTILRRKVPGVDISSQPDASWNHVFVPTAIPWKHLSQSALWHLVLLAMIWNLSQGWMTSEEILLRKSHNSITYTPSFPTSGSYRPASPSVAKSRPPASAQRGMLVRTGGSHETAVAPAVKMTSRARLTLASWNPTARPVLSAAASPQAPLAPPGGPSLVRASVVAPPPQIAGVTGAHTGSGLGAFVVAPSPKVDSPLRALGNSGMGGSRVVPPPPQIGGVTGQRAGTGLGSFVVSPSPDVASALRGLGNAGLGDSRVIAPAPGMPLQERSALSGGSLGSSAVAPAPDLPARETSTTSGIGLGGSGNFVVPPAPAGAGSDSLASARGGSLSGIISQVPMPAPAIGGTQALAGSGGRSAMIHPPNTPLPPPELDEPANRTTRELPMRMISLALALPNSSFFSNYEVFIAERRVNKDVSQLIKLVYESRPNQRRISEYDLSAAKVYKLRVTRDASCDETALQMAGEHYTELKSVTKRQGLRLPEQDGILPCYRSTVDDYQKALARGR